MKRSMAVVCAVFLARFLWALSLPAGWDFGSTPDDRPVSTVFTATNDEARDVSVRLISPCDCLALSPSAFTLAPGKSARVSVTFDPKGYSGSVNKPVLVKAAGGVDGLYTMTGTVLARSGQIPPYSECEWCRKQSAEIRRQAYESWRKQPSVVHYYYSPDCGTCTAFLDSEVPRVEKLISRKIEMDRQDIRTPGVIEELDGILARKKLSLTALPVLVAADTVLVGEKAIREGFEKEMRRRASP